MLVTPDQYAKPAAKSNAPPNRPSSSSSDAGAGAAATQRPAAAAAPPSPSPYASGNVRVPRAANPAAAASPPPRLRLQTPDSGHPPAPTPAPAPAPTPTPARTEPNKRAPAAAAAGSNQVNGGPAPRALPPGPQSPGPQPTRNPVNRAAGPPPPLDPEPQPGAEAGDDPADDDDINGQAVEILAGLTSLGISQALRDKVHDALQALDRATASAASAVPELGRAGAAAVAVGGPPSPLRGVPPGGGVGGGGGAARPPGDGQIDALERKLAMSRNIMRKLYHKNVHLEKELALLTTNAQPVTSLDLMAGQGRGRQEHGSPGSGGLRPATSGVQVRNNPVAQAIQERDSTIVQLQHALDAVRRRCTLLEAQAAGGGLGGAAGGGGAGAGPDARSQQQAGIREVLAQSALHLSKYQQIREDYNRLLYKRTSAVSSSKATSQQARALVDEMQMRLSNEIQEREAEAALYSARLYESERQMSDWYVEKRMLQESIARLNDDASQRDRIDAEIESCICSMFERLKMLEETNARLTAKLEAAGLTGEEGTAATRPTLDE